MTSDITTLSTETLHQSLTDPSLESMNFLNEIANTYPEAISFAPGRPFEDFFSVGLIHDDLARFEKYLAVDKGYTPEVVRRTFFQYGRTKGIIHDVIAEYLKVDEGCHVDPESIVVTTGCQEAMLLTLRALRRDDRDVMLAVAPTYVGLTGAARLVDMPVIPVAGSEGGVDFDDLIATVRRVRAAGQRPRALYILPDFSNPSGLTLDLDTRRGLLDLAERENFLILEDNPYGLFHGGTGRLPTLKSMDEKRRVVYLGSFAKTVLPGARVGFLVADQAVRDEAGSLGLFADELAKIKSMVSVNTSAISQAVVAGRLLQHGYSLVKGNEREVLVYQANLRRLTQGLERHLAPFDGVHWNVPVGGFFLVVTVPFPADDALVRTSASDYGVLWTPMRHFYDNPAAAHQIRLSYSLLRPEEIDEGLERLASLVRDRMP
ncbi:PLP-dependent aminotransferase family protein [Streptomyces sp. NPDC005322]|uniref:aminotransferase-like domain-containing protein n=1 Tax=Streptomyces sp. NPDC005322 TaxID=3157032 RepID=UPI0033A0E241